MNRKTATRTHSCRPQQLSRRWGFGGLLALALLALGLLWPNAASAESCTARCESFLTSCGGQTTINCPDIALCMDGTCDFFNGMAWCLGGPRTTLVCRSRDGAPPVAFRGGEDSGWLLFDHDQPVASGSGLVAASDQSFADQFVEQVEAGLISVVEQTAGRDGSGLTLAIVSNDCGGPSTAVRSEWNEDARFDGGEGYLMAQLSLNQDGKLARAEILHASPESAGDAMLEFLTSNLKLQTEETLANPVEALTLLSVDSEARAYLTVHAQ